MRRGVLPACVIWPAEFRDGTIVGTAESSEDEQEEERCDDMLEMYERYIEDLETAIDLLEYSTEVHKGDEFVETSVATELSSGKVRLF
jgi:hypothetical protein